MGATHGSESTYTNRACRCDECRAEHARLAHAHRSRRAAQLAADPSLAEHGKDSTYTNWGCRCDECRRANTAKRGEWTRSRRSR